jgi:hypothetical protein
MKRTAFSKFVDFISRILMKVVWFDMLEQKAKLLFREVLTGFQRPAFVGAHQFLLLDSNLIHRFRLLADGPFRIVHRLNRFVSLHQFKRFADPVSAVALDFLNSHSAPAVKSRFSANPRSLIARHFDRFVFLHRLRAFPIPVSAVA